MVRNMVKLTLIQKIILKLNGRVYTEHKMRHGWRAPIPFYAFRCDKHGLVEDYPHGYEGRLDCPKCVQSINSARETRTVIVDEQSP